MPLYIEDTERYYMDINMTFTISDGEKSIDLTEAEARELYQELKRLFGDDPPYTVPSPLNPIFPNTPWWQGPLSTGTPQPEMPYTVSNTFTVTPGTSGIGEVTTN